MAPTSFWDNLELPIIGLAPMDGVTDAAFRYITAKYGRPSLTITEFTSAEGIRAGATTLLDDFLYNEIERPVIAQLFGADPAAFYGASAVAAALGFDGVDINMGCPAKNVTQHGAGASLILDPERAKAIIRQARAGIEAWANGASLEELGVHNAVIEGVAARSSHIHSERRSIPVSVKTRIGYDHSIIEEWIQHLLEVEPAAITVHGRTLKQLYTGTADWEAIRQAATLIHQTPTRVLGNGDVASIADAHARIAEYKVDGVLIGRAAFGNPWIFQNQEVDFDTRLRTALEHSRYLASICHPRAFVKIRKHLLDYVKMANGARDLRVQLMKVESLEDIERILIPLVEG